MRPASLLLVLIAGLGIATVQVHAKEPQVSEPGSTIPIAELLRDVPLVDGHNDLIIHFIDFETGEFKNPDDYDIRVQTTGQTDIPRMREGMLGGAIFTIATADDNAPEEGLEASISLLRELVSRSPADLALVSSPDDLIAAHEAGKIAIIMGLEGGNPVEGDPGRLAWMQERGVAEMGLVWSTNGLGTAGRNSETDQGLTELGKQVVREMNRLGMIIDLSHASPATVRDVTAITTAPVIDTHAVAGPFAYGDEGRVDASMKAIAATGGLVMPMFMPDGIAPEYKQWMDLRNAELAAVAVRILGEEKGQYPLQYSPWPDDVARDMEIWIAANPPPAGNISDIADVYDYVRNLIGIDHMGIGSDFDGMGFHPSSWHAGLKDVSRLPSLLEELRMRGWSDSDLRKLAGENFLRVWREIQSRTPR